MKKKRFAVMLALLGLLSVFPFSSTSSVADGLPKAESVVLSKDNTLVLNGEVNGETVGAVISAAKELDNALSGIVKSKLGFAKKPLYLFLYTPGGEIETGLELIEALQGLGRPVHVVILFAASMGFQIAQNLDDRLILKSGTLMSHHAAGQISGQFGGVSTQMESRHDFWLEKIREMDEQTVKRTNGKQTYESYTKAYDHEQWLTGSKAVAQGYADKVVTMKCDATMTGVTAHHVNFFGFDISYDLDNCPINTNPMNIKIAAPDGKTILTTRQEYETKQQFLMQYEQKAKQVIPMYWRM